MIDWGIGRYEQTAAELAPVAEHVISLARPQPGERLLDLATGTGNAALLGSRARAQVTGLDAAERLIAVARDRAASEGLPASFLVGDLQALPFAEDSFEVVVSVFGLIFARDPERALGEVVRVLGPGGRALVSAWVPEGPIDAMVAVFARPAIQATGAAPERFAWHDRTAVGELAARHGAELRVHEGNLTITHSSPDAYLESNERTHPMSLAMRPLLESRVSYPELRERALAVLREGNEDPDGFRVTSPYRVLELRL